jgi:hypothetical protein
MMADEEATPDALREPELQDHLLTTLVGLANDVGFGFGITMCVGGLLVTGTLAGGREWTDALVGEIRSTEGGEILANGLETVLHELYPEPRIAHEEDGSDDRERRPAPTYIHLVNARIFDASGGHLPSNRGVPWRGRLSQVDGWSMGSLSTS